MRTARVRETRQSAARLLARAAATRPVAVAMALVALSLIAGSVSILPPRAFGAPAGAAGGATPSFSVTPEGEDTPARATLFGVRASSTAHLAKQITSAQRFNLRAFLPASSEATSQAQTNEQARVADYTFLRALDKPDLRAAVGQAPNRDYAQIQRQLAAQQKQQEAALTGWGDLSAVLFATGPDAGSGAPGGALVAGVAYLTPAQVSAISGWQSAKASWYGPGFYGNQTASGDIYTAADLLVANRTLPLGTKVAISYGGRTIVAEVKDRGPYVAGRDFDLSSALATALGFSGVQTIRWAIAP